MNRLSELRAHRHPHPQKNELRVEMRQRAGAVGRRGHRATGVANLGQQQGRARVRPGRLDERVKRRLRQLAEGRGVHEPRNRLLGVHVDRDEL